MSIKTLYWKEVLANTVTSDALLMIHAIYVSFCLLSHRLEHFPLSCQIQIELLGTFVVIALWFLIGFPFWWPLCVFKVTICHCHNGFLLKYKILNVCVPKNVFVHPAYGRH